MENKEENINENEEEKEEVSEELDQEELAKQWEEALKEQEKKEEPVNQEELAKEWEDALKEQEETNVPQEEMANQWEEALKQQKEKGVHLEKLPIENEKLEILLDIPLEISVEIGSKVMLLEDVLKLNPNTILELDRYINEPVDIRINGKLVAKGELYTVENNFGIKIINIITVQERIKLFMEQGGE